MTDECKHVWVKIRFVTDTYEKEHGLDVNSRWMICDKCNEVKEMKMNPTKSKVLEELDKLVDMYLKRGEYQTSFPKLWKEETASNIIKVTTKDTLEKVRNVEAEIGKERDNEFREARLGVVDMISEKLKEGFG